MRSTVLRKEIQMSTERTEPVVDTFYIVPLEQLGRDDLDLAGGKGANLGELVKAGFPVPKGFVVTTDAYDLMLKEAGLGKTIAAALEEGPTAGATIWDAFLAADVPPGIRQEIVEVYRDLLGAGAVAVRSSATVEDLPEAAFAGQQDTFLNVMGEQPLLDAVRRCWASLWTDRAIAYRERQGIDQQTVKLAVVVQQMVPAEVAGVLFTANPVTGARDVIVIDASPGLGEAVVSGQVTPDRFVLRKRRWGWSIVERRPGKREVMIRPRSGGGTEHVEGLAATDVPALPDRALRQLARLGAAIERHCGRPQDVEWARAGGELSIVQARPITALPEPVRRLSRPMKLWAGILTELLPDRPYPLEVTTWGPQFLVSAILAPMFRILGVAVHLDRSIVEEDGVVVRFTDRFPFRPTPGILLAPLRLLRLAWRYDPARWQSDPLLAEVQARARVVEARDLRALSWAGLLDTVHEALAIPHLVGELRIRYVLPRAPALGLLRLMLTLLGAGNRFGALLFTGLESRTLEANRALEALGACISSDPALADAFSRHEAGELMPALEAQPAGRAFLTALRAFLDEYGHREAGATLQVSQPTWKDAPEVVLGILKGLAAAPPRAAVKRPAWEVALDELLSHPLLRIPPLRSAFLRLLTEARWFPQIREDTRFYATLILPVLRRTLLEFGRRLAGVGVLDAPEDVFHLKLDELERIEGAWPPPPHLAGELRALMVRRKAKRAELEGTPLVDPRFLRQAEVGGDVLLRGIPGSPGVADGTVRIVHDASEFGKLLPGEVLVAPYTNPAWTPLFQRVVAVVVDSGGAGSHAAIVAREYGIPAVMATIDGTHKLSDGQRVRVDGDQGLVLSIDEAGI
jgi:phosphohistidine swiveling domain-containing protein